MGVIRRCARYAYCVAVQVRYGVQQKTVVFRSFGGKSYSDNPRAISEALHKLSPDTEICWILTNPESKRSVVPDYVKCIPGEDKFAVHKILSVASVYVDNFGFPYLPKSRKQMFIQTWHGDKAFKKVLYACRPKKEQKGVFEERPGYCDYAIAGSDYGEMQYRTAFHYNGPVLKFGMPRNDKLLQEDVTLIRRIREATNIPTGAKVLLYAPTLRQEAADKNKPQQIQTLDLLATLNCLEKRDGCQWVCLVRAHPSVVGLEGVAESERIIMASGYEDMSDLLLVSDMLITDYSSCAGDFALTRRPIVLFQSDMQEYLEKDRTLYFNIEDSPYFVAKSQKELEELISAMTAERARENCEAILAFYGNTESGRAAVRIAEIIKAWTEQ